jgi:hypothetical protein
VQARKGNEIMTVQFSKALTVRQPWAVPITWGFKPVENRTWDPRFPVGGTFAVHAGRRDAGGWDQAGAASPLVQAAWQELCEKEDAWVPALIGDARIRPPLVRGLEYPSLLPFQAITALADLAGAHPSSQCLHQDPATLRVEYCTPWSEADRFHLVLDNVRRLPEPVPCRGMMNFWTVPDDIRAAVLAGLGEAA